MAIAKKNVPLLIPGRGYKLYKMAEQEVIKHTKKIYDSLSNKEHSFWGKLKDFLLEIFIIVFAISLSLWFHNQSEHRHQQADVKDFLKGLKQDLIADISEMKSDLGSYNSQGAAFTYLSNLKINEPVQKDRLRFYYSSLFNTTALNPNNGRFEGFKSSGRIGNIENDALQNDIMDLYQENIPSLLAATSGYLERKNRLYDYLAKNHKRLTDSTTNMAEILNTEEAHNICAILSATGEIAARYQAAISKMEQIIGMIDAEYKELAMSFQPLGVINQNGCLNWLRCQIFSEVNSDCFIL